MFVGTSREDTNLQLRIPPNKLPDTHNTSPAGCCSLSCHDSTGPDSMPQSGCKTKGSSNIVDSAIAVVVVTTIRMSL